MGQNWGNRIWYLFLLLISGPSSPLLDFCYPSNHLVTYPALCLSQHFTGVDAAPGSATICTNHFWLWPDSTTQKLYCHNCTVFCTAIIQIVLLQHKFCKTQATQRIGLNSVNLVRISVVNAASREEMLHLGRQLDSPEWVSKNIVYIPLCKPPGHQWVSSNLYQLFGIPTVLAGVSPKSLRARVVRLGKARYYLAIIWSRLTRG